MREYGTLVLKFSATYSEVEGADVEAIQEAIVEKLADYGDVETTLDYEEEGEVEIEAKLSVDAVRTVTEASWDNPGDSEISVEITETDLKNRLMINGNSPFIYISDERWEAA